MLLLNQQIRKKIFLKKAQNGPRGGDVGNDFLRETRGGVRVNWRVQPKRQGQESPLLQPSPPRKLLSAKTSHANPKPGVPKPSLVH